MSAPRDPWWPLDWVDPSELERRRRVWARGVEAFVASLIEAARNFEAHANQPHASGETLDDVSRAEALLGVSRVAASDEIRAALRRRLAESGAHPDHGGDVEHARRLIAARDLLLSRVRA